MVYTRNKYHDLTSLQYIEIVTGPKEHADVSLECSICTVEQKVHNSEYPEVCTKRANKLETEEASSLIYLFKFEFEKLLQVHLKQRRKR